jgi:hypothetical protein
MKLLLLNFSQSSSRLIPERDMLAQKRRGYKMRVYFSSTPFVRNIFRSVSVVT